MRTIDRSLAFKRDYRSLAVGRHRAALESLLATVHSLLATDTTLPAKYRDHALVGEWHGCRDCHLRPDLVLIYRRPDAATLQLVRLGSRSTLDL